MTTTHLSLGLIDVVVVVVDFTKHYYLPDLLSGLIMMDSNAPVFVSVPFDSHQTI